MIKTKKRKNLTLTNRRAITGLLFISPFILGFLIFYVRSLIMTIQFSLSEVIQGDGMGYSLNFIGLDNFKYAFTEHPSFNQLLVRSIGDMLIDVPLILFFSLFIAIVLNQKFRGRTVARAIFFLPVLLNAPAIFDALTSVRAMMLGGTSPAPAAMVEAVSAGGSAGMGYYIQLMGDLALPSGILDYIVGAVARINYVITASGVQIIIFLAALQSISPSLYEVAKIEGATTYETFWKVTFPMVSPLLVTNMVYTVLDSFINSAILQEAYETMFTYNDYALSAVISLMSMVTVCGILGIVSWLVSKRVYYHN